MIYAPRTLVEIASSNSDGGRVDPVAVALESVRDVHAYVLLGDPGMGKTTAFKREAEAIGLAPIRVRDFIGLQQLKEQWADKTLFIDGLDETRAGVQDGRTVLDQIRGKLEELGVPRFRISCREADWLGSSDREALERLLQGKSSLKVFRLEKLSRDDIETLLLGNYEKADPKVFVRDAERLGLDGLLGNPQTLKVLAAAVGNDNKWPETRAEAYQFACEKLAVEPNKEHAVAKRKSWPNVPSLLDAAGYLSAISLCSNRSEIRLTASDEDSDALAINEIDNAKDLPLPECLETNLFVGTGENAALPAHRSIAEYLGAKYLAQRIADGVSVGRVLALLIGADGGVITSLRGLHAWLAACSATARARLIETDPLGVLLYGDAKAFAVSEKKLLLRCLHRNAESNRDLRGADWNSDAFASIATPDMVDEIKLILKSPSREKSNEVVAQSVVMGLSAGEAISGMGSVLLDVTRDSSRWKGVRRYALRTYLKKYLESPQAAITLLEDISNGAVVDSDDELLGVLLRYLYPEHLTVVQALDHLHNPKKSSLLGNYQLLWRTEFLENTTAEHLPELLDTLAQRPPLPNSADNDGYWTLARNALTRGLVEWGDAVDANRIYLWLGITLGEHDHNHLPNAEKSTVNMWLKDRPETHKQLITIAIAKLRDDESLWTAVHRLHDVPIPVDFVDFLLELADKEHRPRPANDLFAEAVNLSYDQSTDSSWSIDALRQWVIDHPKFAEVFERKLVCEIEDWRAENADRHAAARKKNAQRISNFADVLRTQSPEALHIQALDQIALAHEGRFREAAGEAPIERLKKFFNNDADLVLKGLFALWSAPKRVDLPSADQVLQSHLEGKRWLLSQPLLIGIERLHQTNPAELLTLPEANLRTAVMSSYVQPFTKDMSWRKAVAELRPDIVAEAFIDYASADLKAGKCSLSGAYELTTDGSYGATAQLAIPAVLEKFPRRATVDQLFDLDRLIKGLLSIFSTNEAISLVRSKLSLKTLDVGQRTYWMAAGLLLAPLKYEKSIRGYVAQNEVRIGHLSRFLEQRNPRSDLAAKLPSSIVSMLVELMGPNCRPEMRDDGESGEWGAPDTDRARLVRNWINQLSANPTAEACDALGRLQLLPELTPWMPQLREALASQTVVMRDATYKFPAPRDVVTTLAKGQPANVADLFAIINDELGGLIKDIEHSDLDAYKQFWNVDSHNTPTEASKPEDACRDTLCTLLRERLKKQGVNCEIESRHADQKRSDIWCAHDAYGVPIEAKQQAHDDLWKALQGQLVAKYSSDPRAHGYGIYLVFWLKGKLPKPPNQGKKPKTAAELKVRLEQQITVDQQPFLSVHVLDLSLGSRR